MDDNGDIRSLSGVISDINGATLSRDNLQRIQALDLSSFPIVSPNVRLGACVSNVGKSLCIGLNYADHAAESGMTIPDEPEVFTKATSAIFGPNDDIVQPRNSDKLDWEVELAIVIGKHASYVSVAKVVVIILSGIVFVMMCRSVRFN
ncbi:fumarylacetoacetate hydrolase family protein [Colwellia maritima]|uniref:fumarylacetoacetate hydrolase family protein n=1 Tax=Colwellia maritima TaxID=2912588 RepID=UPI00237B4993|nr:fumarylacetoacetate hydrolase family protein [Colwellia maritima]